MATISPPHHVAELTANVTGVHLSGATTLTLKTPEPPVEYVPDLVMATLSTFRWNAVRSGGCIVFTHDTFAGYYSWSEALVLETSRAFLELHK